MGIRAHPRLTNGKTSKGHIGTQSRGCAGQTVRPSLHSISQTSVGKLLNRPTVRFYFLHSWGSREAIPSEPPSLACPIRQDWRATVRASIPLVNLSKPISSGIGCDPRLVVATSGKHSPGDAGELVGERDRQQIAMGEALGSSFDPWPQS